jgi:hypothetical protein
LEEKREGDSSSDEESDYEETKGAEQDDSDIIGKLMGGKGKKAETNKPSIQEMAE